MITFRCSERGIDRFRIQPVEEAPPSTGILGDWYVNLLNVGPQRLVLCVSERTLLQVILPARRDSFPGRFGEHLRTLLEFLAIPEHLIEAELASIGNITLRQDPQPERPGRDERLRVHGGLPHDAGEAALHAGGDGPPARDDAVQAPRARPPRSRCPCLVPGWVNRVSQSSISVPSAISLRRATIGDVPALTKLIAESARVLCAGDYTPAQIEAALGTAWGVDTELTCDGTYLVAEVDGEIVACGGWSQRATLFGGDHQAGRQSQRLHPDRDAARIRAFFVRPGWDRRGTGRALLEKCEAEAQAHAFRSAELVATLPGQRLYRALGYSGDDEVEYPLGGGLTIAFVPMRKQLA